jgi:hypothetical protein
LKKYLILPVFVALLLIRVSGQTMPFGSIDTADLKMTSCDFEKDANAEVLFDCAVVTYKYSTVVVERHKRIKIFNDNGKDAANIRIEFAGVHHDEEITNIQAETINLEGKNIVYTPIDPKSIYPQAVDKDTKAFVFTFPDVRSGSVIEFKYKSTTPYGYNYPDWFFQTSIPSRYSEFDASFIPDFPLLLVTKIYQPLVKDTSLATVKPRGTRRIWAMANIRTYKKEPYMDYPDDYVQCVLTKVEHRRLSWMDIGNGMLDDEDFGYQIKKTITGQAVLLNNAAKLKTDKDKIAYLFDTVKNAMKWNKTDRWFCIDGVKRAWDKKTGNSTEINLMLYNLLATANVNTWLLALRTRDYGELDIDEPSWSALNKVVVYAQADSSTYYVLDASDKFNTFDNTPIDLIGLKALQMEAVSKKYDFKLLKTGNARVVTLINGAISPDGKLEGTSQVSNSSYARKEFLETYNELGEKNYIDKIQRENSGLKITSLKLENVAVDSLPLNQTFEFKYNLTEPDGDYMYFNPNLFTGLGDDPFLNDTRISNIDFGPLYSYSINGRYKLPAGYKTDVLPKSVSMQMPDKGILFKRVVAEQDGFILVHYSIVFKNQVYKKDDYPDIRDFYKKMYEMLNEQIVLKKS